MWSKVRKRVLKQKAMGIQGRGGFQDGVRVWIGGGLRVNGDEVKVIV